MRIRRHDTLRDLENDQVKIVRRAPRDMNSVVRGGIRVGNALARDNAKRSAGEHGKHYPNAFSAEMRPPFELFGTRIYSGEFGPDISKPQGGMSFEEGSRNQKPHWDLARAADIIGPATAGEVRRLPDKWFWG